MSTSEGFSCELNDRDRAQQARRWKDQAIHIVRHARSEKGFRVTFDTACHDQLVALVATERECCGWANWLLTTATDGTVLEVTGPAPEIAELAGAFGL
jgi:hypothetical protein